VPPLLHDMTGGCWSGLLACLRVCGWLRLLFFCVGGRLERLLGGGNVMRCVAFVFLFFLSCAAVTESVYVVVYLVLLHDM
jgi:hypothetical protein